jgi:GT2 family glycosyltransferase
MIYYSNPFAIDKNIGKAYNKFCELVPNDDDWIVLQDGDMMYLTPDWGNRINEAIHQNGQDFALLAPVTNRLNVPHQLHNNQFSNDHNIINHFNIAKGYNNPTAKEVESVAGVCMIFQKKTWKKIGGFVENSRTFDTQFCIALKKKGFRIGLIQNLYVYHQYRIWSETPQKDVKHLE